MADDRPTPEWLEGFRAGQKAGTGDERERCAKIAEDTHEEFPQYCDREYNWFGSEIAIRIRDPQPSPKSESQK